MNCPYCDAVTEDSADRCPSCLKHLPNAAQMNPEPTNAGSTADDERLLEPSAVLSRRAAVMPGQVAGLILSGLFGSIVVAALYAFICRTIDLFLIFPMVAGLIVGGILGRAVTRRKIRSIPLVACVAIITGILTYCLKLGFEAYTARPMMLQAYAQRAVDESGAPMSAALSYYDHALTPWATFRVYLKIQSRVGISIHHVGTSMAGDIAIRGPAYWALLAIECGLLTWAGTYTAVKAASTSFCEKCQAWRPAVNLVFKNYGQSGRLVDLVRRRDWLGARDLTVEGGFDYKNCSYVSAEYCRNCGEGQVVVGTVWRGKSKLVFRAQIPVESMRALRAIDDDTSASTVVTAR